MVDRKRKKARELFTLLLDVGSNTSAHLCEEDVDDLTSALQTLDWVLSRKIFTQADDEFSLIFFGYGFTKNELLPDFSNIYVHNQEYQPAKIEWLKLLESGIVTNTKCNGNFISALFVGLESLRWQIENNYDELYPCRTITIFSNFAGLDDSYNVMNYIPSIAAGFRELSAQLMVIGPDFSSDPKNDNQKQGFEFVNALLKEINGCKFSFREGLSQLKYFVPKQVQSRGQPFDLELAADFSIKVQMHIKNTETSMKFKFDAVASTFACDGAVQPVQLKKRRAYETVADSEQINLTDLDAISDDVFHGTAALPTGKTIDKSNIIKGYRYGQSLIPFGVAEQSLIEYSKKGKQLQLIQFTKIDNILPQFLLSNCRYLLPDSKYPASVDALSALVHAMLELGVVALCRYSYNINSNPRMVCLMPKISKKSNVPVLIHYTMPFNEDLRNYEFPLLEKLGNEPTAYQLDVVDEFINSFDLSNSISGGELMRCKSILNPKHQYQCQLLRQKAMHSNEPLPEIQREKLLENVSPPKQFVKYAKHIIETMKESFPLEKNPYTRVAAFSTNITKKPAANQSLSTENKPENNELDSKSF